MLSISLRRIVQAIPTLCFIATATFLLLRLAPGGPFDQEKALAPEVKAQVEAFYGLDQPLWKQYLHYLGNLLQGELGPSYKYAGWQVERIIGQSFPVSLELGCWAFLVALAIGLPIGIAAALKKGRILDQLLMPTSALGICLPPFVLGPVLLLIFSSACGWLNPLGWHSASDRILPALTMGTFYTAFIARLMRASLLEVLQQDYITSARAKGLNPARVIGLHAVRNALHPVLAYLGPTLAGLITGSFVIESIFFVPGLGQFFVQAAFNRDYTLVMGTVLFYAVLILCFNLLVDLIQIWLNPRSRDA